MNMSQSPLYSKVNLPMLHGEKDSFIFANRWLSIIICTAIVVNGTNNFLVIVVFYFLGDRLA